MKQNFPKALEYVLKHEAGYVNHPRDPGGATNRGITLGSYRQFVKKNGTVTDLKNITPKQVEAVYRHQYWDAVKANLLPSGVDYAVFDFAVNSGPSRAIKFLQAVVRTQVDGVIGAQTLKAIENEDPKYIINKLCDNRMVFLRNLSHWDTFGRGWTNRVTGVRKQALAMVLPEVVKLPKTPETKPETTFWGWLINLIVSFFKGGSK